jgi:N-acetylmuramoyl-L-alanine amidase
MNWIKKLAIATTLSVSIFSIQAPAADAHITGHFVKANESYWKISNQYKVPIAAILKVNNKNNYSLYTGEKVIIPHILSDYEKDLLARLVHAEAKGESYAGKVAVATVVLNRVDSDLFPQSVYGVVTERSAGGYYAFTPAANGTLQKSAGDEAKRAVEEALMYRGQGSGSLYFYNPQTAKSAWIKTRPVTVTIGNHVFAK